MPKHARHDWTVLLIGGPSGVGKSTAAKQIARQFDADWMQVDDLRLALQMSRVELPDPDDTRALSFFLDPDIWQLAAEQLRDGFIAVGKALSPAIAMVMSNHLALNDSLVLEGDGLLPSLLADSEVRHWVTGGKVRAVFVVSSDESAIRANMVARGRGITEQSAEQLSANVRANWLYGQWLGNESRRLGLPVVMSEPWETLVDRIIEASRVIIDPADWDS